MDEPKLKEKNWNIDFELEILKEWEKEKPFKLNKNAKKIFSIDTPPPYASGAWHMGGAAQYTQIDMIARYRRMTGYEVLFPFGIDRNGLPIEVQTEKEYKISIHQTPREEFIKLCQEFLNKYGTRITNVAKRLGLSCNSWTKGPEIGNLYETDDPLYRQLTQDTFIDLYKRGLIYEEERPTNMCPSCITTIADAEIEYDEKKVNLYYVKFGDAVVATTRPELICTASIILFNPDDDRYRKLINKRVTAPIFGQSIEIKAHPYAKKEYGSGLVMISSFGDYADIRLFSELGLEPKYALTKEGKMTAVCRGYEGLKVSDARNKIAEDLKNKGLLEKIEQIENKVPICWRCKTTLIYRLSKQWFLKVDTIKSKMIKENEKVKWLPEWGKTRFHNWLVAATDWCVSQQRFWGIPLPVWTQGQRPLLRQQNRFPKANPLPGILQAFQRWAFSLHTGKHNCQSARAWPRILPPFHFHSL